MGVCLFVFRLSTWLAVYRRARKSKNARNQNDAGNVLGMPFNLLFIFFSLLPDSANARRPMWFPYFPIPVVKVSITEHIVVSACLLRFAENSFYAIRSILFLEIFNRSVKLIRNSINVIWYSKKSFDKFSSVRGVTKFHNIRTDCSNCVIVEKYII